MTDRESDEFHQNRMQPIWMDWMVGSGQNALDRLDQILEEPEIGDAKKDALRTLRDNWAAQLDEDWVPPEFGSDAEYYPLLARALHSAIRQEHAVSVERALEYLKYVRSGGVPFKNGLGVATDALARAGDLDHAARLARVFLAHREFAGALAEAKLETTGELGEADRWINHFIGAFHLGVPMRAALQGMEEAPEPGWAQILELGLAHPRPAPSLPVPPHDARFRADGLAALVGYFEMEGHHEKARALRELYGS